MSLVKYKGPFPSVFVPVANVAVAKGETATVSEAIAAMLLADSSDWEAGDKPTEEITPHFPAAVLPILGFEGTYDPETLYQAGILVEKEGSTYLSRRLTENEDPTTHGEAWLSFAGSLPPSVETGTAAVVSSEAQAEAHSWVRSGEAVFANATAGAFKQPLPAPSAGNKGWRYTVIATATNGNAVTVKPTSGEILGPAGLAVKELPIGTSNLYQAITVISDGGNYHVI